jgi:hypothetical protein
VKVARNSSAFVVALALVAVGCSSDSDVDIGDGQNAARTGEALTDYAAVWDGYAVAYKFADGSDKVRLVIDAEGKGRLTVGDPLPSPTYEAGSTPPAIASIVPGFAFPVQSAKVEAARLRFGVGLNDAIKPWCEAQPPVPFDPSYPEVYSCMRDFAVLQDDNVCKAYDTGEVVNCDARIYCSFVCECSAESCSVGDSSAFDMTRGSGSPMPAATATFDVALADEGSVLEGLLVLPLERIDVRFQRQ